MRDKQPISQPPIQEPAVAPEKQPPAHTGPPPAGPPKPREEPPVDVPPQPLTEPCAVISMTHQQVSARSHCAICDLKLVIQLSKWVHSKQALKVLKDTKQPVLLPAYNY